MFVHCGGCELRCTEAHVEVGSWWTSAGGWNLGCGRRNAIQGPVAKPLLGYEVGSTKGDGGCRWSLGPNVGAGVDEGASAALSVQVVARKQHAVCE